MTPALIGKKIGMTRICDEAGTATPVTVVLAGPCTVLQVRTQEVDGYDAVQLGYEDVKPHRSTRALIGHAALANTGPKHVAREIRLNQPATVARGDVLTAELFLENEVTYVDVLGVTKGRGFAGVMRRHGFGGQPASHGVERKHRSPGSIGGHASGAKGRGIKKGQKMAGQHGHVRRTARCQKVIKVDPEHNLLLIKGSVPGPNGGFVFVRQSKTRR
jgi:large subunit ribosomal protein L3